MKKYLLFLFALMLGLGMGVLYYGYETLYSPNVKVPKKGAYLHIPTGASKRDVIHILYNSKYVEDMKSLIKAMEWLNYGKKIYSGRYKIMPEMGNKQLVRILAANLQSPVNLQIGNVRTPQQLAALIAKQIEVDSASLLMALQDVDLAKEYGFTVDNFSSMFLSNTYQVYWNISLGSLMMRMNKEWNAFWNAKKRSAKLQRSGLSPTEAVVLASIVSEETAKTDEMARVAGVYVNRLKANMLLQADPTVRYATGDFSIRRILIKHTKCQSPYNTYIMKGLPPGPICVPPITAIDAVLNFEKHNYLYFCANPDFSGYHSFAKSYSLHLKNAREYQRALNKLQVFK
ncbi:MAG: endolytic transglycosylase MltG [Bacteroidales bacterium]